MAEVVFLSHGEQKEARNLTALAAQCALNLPDHIRLQKEATQKLCVEEQ